MSEKQQALLGWREWVRLPELGLPPVKAKVDTGARTSCLHAFQLEQFRRGDTDWVRFYVHPNQDNDDVCVCEAPLHDTRTVTDSGGHSEQRPIIVSRILVGDWEGDIEITLTSRDSMKFRMLLGRTAMAKANFLVNPALSYQTGVPTRGD